MVKTVLFGAVVYPREIQVIDDGNDDRLCEADNDRDEGRGVGKVKIFEQ